MKNTKSFLLVKYFCTVLICIFASLVLHGCNNASEVQTVYKYIDIKVSTTIPSGYEAGDVLFKDDTLMSLASFKTAIDNSEITQEKLEENPIIGVLAYSINDRPYFVGTRRAPKKTQWALSTANGFASIPELKGTIGSGQLFGINFLKSVKDLGDFSEENYPAPYWVSNYEPYIGSGEQGEWFLPSVFEAVQIVGVSTKIDEVLLQLRRIDSSYELFFDSNKVNYWTSSTKEIEVVNQEGETIIESNCWVYRNELPAIRDHKKDTEELFNYDSAGNKGNSLGVMSCLVVKRGDYKNYTRVPSE